MKITIIKKLGFLLLVSTIIFGCQPDPTPPAPPNGSMTVQLDTASYDIDTFNNTLLKEVQAGEGGRRLDIRVTVNGGTFILTVSNWDWQMPPEDGVLLKNYDTGEPDTALVGPNTVCKDGVNVTFCDSGLGTYLIGTEQYTSAFGEATEGYITITNNDLTNLTVSGVFEVSVFELFSDEELVFKGNFLNVPYTVVN